MWKNSDKQMGDLIKICFFHKNKKVPYKKILWDEEE